MKRFLITLAALSSLAFPAAASAQQASGCQFVLGFKTLHDMASKDIGDCVGNEFHARNGDGQQETTKGLLAWRKSDNYTAFTNGYITWINGPNGLASRLNGDRFPWEHDVPAATPTAAANPAPAATPAPTATPAPVLPASSGTGPLAAAVATQPITILYSVTPSLPVKLGPFSNLKAGIASGDCTGAPADIICTGSDGSKSEQVTAPNGTLTLDGSGPNGYFHLKVDPAGNMQEMSVDGQQL